MLNIATKFRAEMDQAIALVALIGATRNLAQTQTSGQQWRSPAGKILRNLHRLSIDFTSTHLAYDGIYLVICAHFELTVRQLIEQFVEELMASLTSFHHLPSAIKDWHPTGCAQIMMKMNQESFGHLTPDALIANLASCLNASAAKPYKLTTEAYSFNEHNFRPSILEEQISKRLGLSKVWQKLSRQPSLTTFFKATRSETVENLSRKRLEDCMLRRNQIIHRGRTYYTAGETEVIDCAKFLCAFTESLANVLVKYRDSL